MPCKQVYACQHFLDYGGEARQAGQVNYILLPNYLFSILAEKKNSCPLVKSVSRYSLYGFLDGLFTRLGGQPGPPTVLDIC